MPEIKHDFSAGKMNKDLDERLVSNGEYRDAMNIQVRTTSAEDGGGDAGTVQNIKGNKQVIESVHYEYPYVVNDNSPNETSIIASIANEKNNTAYFFVAAPRIDPIITSSSGTPQSVTSRKLFIDTIVEVNTGTGISTPTCLPVAVDKWGVIDLALPDNDGNGVLQTPIPATIPPGTTWTQFNAINSDDYQIGMTIKAIGEDGEIIQNWGVDANGDGDGTVEIQNIESAGMGVSTITLYTEQLPVEWSDIKFFIFEAPRVLNFNNTDKITGINIIDDLLFWTDNSSEPKRINIKKCKLGTSTYTSHTQLQLEDPIDSDIISNFTSIETSLSPTINNDLKEEHVTVIRKAPLIAPTLHMKSTDREGETTTITNFFYNAASVDFNGDGEYDQIQPGDIIPGGFPNADMITAYELNTSNQNNDYDWVDATMFEGIDYRENDILVFSEETGGSDSWFSVLINSIEIDDGGYTILGLTVLTVNGTLPPVTLDINSVPVVNGSGSWTITLDQRTPLFELKFGRFGCRYKYEDGEYSSFGPWSEIAFLPGRFDYDYRHGYNKGMTNNARELIIRDFIPHQRTRNNDIVAVDILYKTTVSPNVYVVKTITRGIDPEWDMFITEPGLNENPMAFGEINITSEMIHKALPANQLLRSWDNVPRYALGQEMAANRIVFSNYTQGYDLKNLVGLTKILNIDDNSPSIETPQKSIKSIRDYKFGMVFGDKYGRETPVIAPGHLSENEAGDYTLTDASVYIEKTHSPTKNTFILEQDWEMPNYSGEPDEWISYVKYFIKETSNEYYNLVMDRWYEAEDGNIWLSFQSADRNKLDEETYLLLKNDHGSETPVLEKARYKILAIENEAPDFIKRRAQNMGEVEISSPNNDYSLEYMFEVTSPTQTDAETTEPSGLMNGTRIAIDVIPWGGFLDGFTESESDLEIRVRAKLPNGSSVKGQTWRLITYHHKQPDTANDAGVGALRWDKPFFSDANMYERFLAIGETNLEDIRYYLDFREMVTKNEPEFDGKFFVKVEKDEILKTRILKYSGESTNYIVDEAYPIAYINNSQYNPSMMNSIENDDMPRRNYKWFTNSTATEDFDENSDPSNLVTVDVGVQDSVTTSTWVDGSSANIAKFVQSDGSGPYTTFWNHENYCRGSNSPSDGCHSYDAEYMALGCFDHDGLDNGTLAKWGDRNPFEFWNCYYAGWDQDGASTNITDGEDTGETVYNRCRETKQFWKWWIYVSGIGGTTGLTETSGHGATVFIDGMRGRKTILGPTGQETSTIPVCNAEVDTVTGETLVQCEDYNGMYYKPQGYEQGILVSSSGAEEVFNPTAPGEFGAITLSVLSQMEMFSSGGVEVSGAGWNSSNGYANELRQRIESYGCLFRFQNDPNKRIYKVVSNEVDIFTTYNHSAHYEDVEGEDRKFTYWVAENSLNLIDSLPWGTRGNPWYGFNNQCGTGIDPNDYTCNDTADCSGIMNFTNQDPVYKMINDSGEVVQSGYANGSSTFIKVGGFTQQGSPPYSGSSAPWYEGPGGKNNLCKSCYRWPTSNGTFAVEDDTCIRTGFRFEFREFDPIEGKLVNNNGTGNKGIDPTDWDPRGAICHDGREAMKIQIMQEGTMSGEVVIPIAHAACWETEPKEDVDLDIYYEASNAIPTRLNSENTSNFAPYGSKVTKKVNPNNTGYAESSWNPNNLVQEQSKDHFVSHIGYTKTNSIIGIKSIQQEIVSQAVPIEYQWAEDPVYQTIGVSINDFFVFEHPDGTKTMSKVIAFMKPLDDDGSDMPSPYVGVDNISETIFKESTTQTGFFKIDSDVWKFPVELGWFNCYTWGNGVESDRIRDDYNAPQIDNGVKVSTTFLDYGRERRGSGMIYSGIYNSTSGVNNLNEFNMAEKITKDINPSYGSIQRLKTRDTDVVVFTEDKVLRVTTNKDALYNADGNPQLMASNRVLGTAVPFGGDYGISNNPESLAWDQYRLYFTDMQRGAVLRLSQNGLTPISNVGMKTWFRDNLKKTNSLLGTFDPVNGEYNITLDYKIGYDDNKTVSFNEGGKGWVSFKSFAPEAGVGVGGKYITALSKDLNDPEKVKKGIWEHHVDITKTDNTAINFGKVINRNVFYATNDTIQAEGVGLEPYHDNSTLSILFNDIPSSVKAFRTVNYEGSQSRVLKFTTENTTQPDGTPFNEIKDGEYYNLNEVDGWWVSSIKTDLSSRLGGDESLYDSTILEFKNKEGKWFNKIVGANRSSMTDQDLNEFSVQGLGKAKNLPPTPVVEEITININSDMVDDAYNTQTGDGSSTNIG